jgi:hypothetical protein
LEPVVDLLPNLKNEAKMAISESKSNLGRLMAEEDLHIEQRNVQTAYFEPETRLLVLPTLKANLSNDVTDLMLSHEVGHALHTKSEPWMSAIESGIKKGVLNVVEDSRIERLIKSKYPGLKSSYSRGYKELFDMDFFGLSKLDIEKLNFVDRINLHCKVGFIKEITFSEKEENILKKVESTKSFEDVVRVSREIQNFLKEEYEEKQKQFAENYESGEESELKPVFDDTGELVDQEESESDSDEFDESDSANSDELEDSLRAFTDEFSQEQIRNLYANDWKETVYVDVPDINTKDYIVGYSDILLRLKSEVPELFVKQEDKFNKFKVENANIVSYLVKEFTLKKNAQGRKKAKESKSGDIHLGKLYSYKFNNDIFRRNTKVPGEKNHSMIFYLDWSGSMTNIFNDTIKQLLCLVMFCKKLNIPYEVYAFSSAYYPLIDTRTYDERMSEYDNFEYNTMNLKDLNLLNLFSYKMNNNEFVNMANVLLSYGRYGFERNIVQGSYPDTICRIPSWFDLGNTPLDHSVIVSQKVSEEFKSKTKTDIINNIFLTDGESHYIKFKTTKGGWYNLTSIFHKVFLRNKKSRVTIRLDAKNKLSETNACVKMAKESTGFRYFGFRLIERREIKRDCYEFFNTYDYTKIWNILKKDNCIETQNTGFDKFYFVRTNLISDDEQLNTIEENETVGSIYKKYDKSISSKLNNRIFIKKFIEFVS